MEVFHASEQARTLFGQMMGFMTCRIQLDLQLWPLANGPDGLSQDQECIS